MDQLALACPVCGSSDVVDLPVPNPTRSMISDGKLMPRPLQRRSCKACGYGFHATPPDAADLRDIYDASYTIGLRDGQAEHERALAYGSQISGILRDVLGPDFSISSLVEFGSGSGSLLGFLAREWNCDVVTGVEPSARLVEHSRRQAAPGTRIEECFAEAFDPRETAYDLCLSVNVVEHAASPSGYLRACRNAVSRDGIVVVICPDGERATSELLFYDHISSFTVCSMELAAREAGLSLVANAALSGILSGFRAYVLRPGATRGDCPSAARAGLAEARSRFIGDWRRIEAAVLKVFEGRAYAIFGTGEFADLLAAYSPAVIDRARCFVVDAPLDGSRGEKPVVATKAFLFGAPIPLLAAVNERSWPGLKQRFASTGTAIFHPYELAQKRTAS
ncbi:MAG: class I SAM-dependent methyltransferase [Rhizobiaceae bacterium]|nr:class I SAM-dependent methyltransferase [Rhizobiaceae bacterium]